MEQRVIISPENSIIWSPISPNFQNVSPFQSPQFYQSPIQNSPFQSQLFQNISPINRMYINS
jgi:hypothetical protein